MKRKSLYLLMLFLLVVLVIRNHSGCVGSENQEIIKPRPPAPVIKIVPKLESNFLFDDFDKAISLSKIHNRKLIAIFGAEWCPYCVVLKKDSKTIREFDKYIVVFLDTDNKKDNQSTINLYRPKSLPTSILIDTNKQELSRKIGYKNKDYTQWLKQYSP